MTPSPLRARVRRVVTDSLPLLISYAATVAGTAYIVRTASAGDLAAYLIVSVFCPQLGLWSDWGRNLALVVRTGDDPAAYVVALRSLVVRLPLLIIPTILVGVALLVVLPLTGELAPRQLIGVTCAAAVATFLIGLGNCLRTALLALGRRTAYFWTQLWIAAGLPLAVAALRDVALGILVCSGLYLAQQVVLLQRIMPKAREGAARAVRIGVFLRGDGLSWAIGGTQLLTAASVSVEIPLLVALAPEGVLAYYAVSRLLQGVVSIANRPIERGLPDVVAAVATRSPDRVQEWRSAVTLAASTAAIGGFALLAGGSFLAELWLGEEAKPGLLLVALLVPAAMASVLYRAAATEAVARQQGQRLIVMSIADLVAKLTLAVLLIPLLGSAGMGAALVLSLILALILSDRLNVARGRADFLLAPSIVSTRR